MKSLFELGVRLVVLFYLLISTHAIIGLIYYNLYGIFSSDSYPFDFYSALQYLVYIFGVFIFIKPNIITKYVNLNDDELNNSIELSQFLRVGLILFGIDYLIGTVSGLTTQLLKLVNTNDAEFMSTLYIGIVVNIFIFALSMVMIYKSGTIANFLLKDKSQAD